MMKQIYHTIYFFVKNSLKTSHSSAILSFNEPIFDLIERAEKWLNTHTYTTQILKWETSVWGEIPADFGRK